MRICVARKKLVLGAFLFLLLVCTVLLSRYFLSLPVTYRSKAAEVGPHPLPMTRNYINGGTPVIDPHTWPFMVLIYKNAQFACTGTLIDPNWVLTAGHCVVDFIQSPSEISVVFYSLQSENVDNNTRKKMDEYAQNKDTKRTREAKQLYLPNDFEATQGLYFGSYIYAHDIALIQLKTPVYGLPTISLSDNPLLYSEKSPIILLGWADYLQVGLAPAVSIERANKITWYEGHIKEWEVPIGYPQGGVGAQYGDSGGAALAWDSSNSLWVQVGILNWASDNPGGERSPTIFASVPYHFSWVQQTIGKSIKKTQCAVSCHTYLTYLYSNSGSFRGTESLIDLEQKREFACRVYSYVLPDPTPTGFSIKQLFSKHVTCRFEFEEDDSIQ